jgi:hypothetical protein
MKQLIECSTCGYPLTPEERTGLVEIDGKMCKPIAPLTDDQVMYIVDVQRAKVEFDTAKVGYRVARAIERAHGIGGAHD